MRLSETVRIDECDRMIIRTPELDAFELRCLRDRRLPRDKHLAVVRSLYRAVEAVGGFRHKRTRAEVMEKAAFARAINGIRTRGEDSQGT